MFPKWATEPFLPDFLGSFERNLWAGYRLLECIGYFVFQIGGTNARWRAE